MSDGPISPLGEAPRYLAYQVERIGFAVEEQPGSGNFYAQPWPVLKAQVSIGLNERIPTATLEIGAGPLLEPADQAGTHFRDWQLLDRDGQLRNAWELLGGGRRLQIRTVRQQPQDDWVLFEGYADKIGLTWSGASASSGEARSIVVKAVSSAVAADREASQAIFGQWRRTRRARIESIKGGLPPAPIINECVYVGVPAVFNPGGRKNCDANPLELADGRTVYVFTDTDAKNATWWTAARILRYLQWAATQSGPPTPSDVNEPYTQSYLASTGHANQRPWTSIGLWHSKLQGGDYNTAESSADVGPNLDDVLATGRLETIIQDGSGPEPDLTLCRPVQQVGAHGLSIIEAFALVCSHTGIVFHVEHTMNQQGRVLTYLRFTCRNDRAPEESEHLDGQSAPFPEGASVPADGTPGDPSFRMVPRAAYQSGRGVYLYVPSDRTDDAAWSTAQIFQRAHHTEGAIEIDVSDVRDRVLVVGDTLEYEATLDLLPGWLPNSDWDINHDDAQVVAAAVNAIYNPPFQDRYGGGVVQDMAYRSIGRRWVANENARATTASDIYRRQFGPWSTAAAWDPPGFLTKFGVTDLLSRGDDGWSARGRAVAAPLARFNNTGESIPQLVMVSFDAGATWFGGGEIGLSCSVDREACGVFINNPRLSDIVNPKNLSENFVSQYLRGRLRLRIAGAIEGDDAVMAWATAPSGAGLGWTEVLDRRRGGLRRALRYKPGAGASPVANSMLITDPHFSGGLEGTEQNDQGRALRLAERVRNELAVPKWSGMASIPWLWRDRFGPVLGYRPGDEVLGLKTQDSVTFVDFLGGDQSRPAPRIAGIVYRFDNGATPMQVTTLAIEAGGDSGILDLDRA